MLIMADSVPALLHLSLFLFFLGLGDSLLNLNTTVGITTIIPTTLCGLFYIFTTFAPVIYPQSPYQNSFSALIWYLGQKMHARRYVDRASGGARKLVSPNMAQGQMQLAMEETEARKGRDTRSIQWLINSLTEDIEMESFVLAIPGSFSSEWGIEVWRKVLETKDNGSATLISDEPSMGSQTGPPLRSLTFSHVTPPRLIGAPRNIFGLIRRPTTMRDANIDPDGIDVTHAINQAPDFPQPNGDFSAYELYKRVRHLFETCNDRGLFANEDAWRRRVHGCVETAASLVCCANAPVHEFGDFGILLHGLDKARETSVSGSDQPFFTRWTCLSLVVTQKVLSDNSQVIQERTGSALKALAQFQIKGVTIDGGSEDDDALKNARRLDERFSTAKRICVKELNEALAPHRADPREEHLKTILHDCKSKIVELERIKVEVDRMEDIEWGISVVDFTIRGLTRGLILKLPGLSFDNFLRWELAPPDQIFAFPVNVGVAGGGPVALQWIFLRQRLRFLGSFGPKLRDILEGQDSNGYQNTLNDLNTIWVSTHDPASIANARHLMEMQVWRLRDLRDGGGFGFMVELFFLSLRHLSSTSPSSDSYSSFYVGTFKVITSDWRRHKHSLGTQQVLLNLVCDLAVDQRGQFSDYPYPDYIVDELLELLGNVFEGQVGSHIDDAIEELRDFWSWVDGEDDDSFSGKAWRVIARTQPLMSSS